MNDNGPLCTSVGRSFQVLWFTVQFSYFEIEKLWNIASQNMLYGGNLNGRLHQLHSLQMRNSTGTPTFARQFVHGHSRALTRARLPVHAHSCAHSRPSTHTRTCARMHTCACKRKPLNLPYIHKHTPRLVGIHW